MFTLHSPLIALVGLTLSTTLSLGAGTSPLPNDINTAVPGHPGMVYLDLLRQLVPDLQPNETIASGTKIEPVRHVLGPFMGSDGMTELPGGITFGSFQTRIGTFEAQRRIVVLASLGKGQVAETPTLLMAFSDEAKPMLVDVLDVAFAERVGFGTRQPVAIGPSDQMVLATSRQHKDDLTELTDVMLFMREGRFEPLGMLARTEKVGCGFQWTQPVTITAQRPITPGPYNDVKVTITDIGSLIDNGCDQSYGEAPFSRPYSALFQWDDEAGRFVADLSEFDSLKALTGARF